MRFDANLKVQQAPDPNLIVLVRRVRVRPTLIFEGRVEGDALIAESRPAAPVTAASKPNPALGTAAGVPATNPTVAERGAYPLETHVGSEVLERLDRPVCLKVRCYVFHFRKTRLVIIL